MKAIQCSLSIRGELPTFTAPRGKADTGIKIGDSIVVRFLDDNKTTSFVLSSDRHDPVNGLMGAETPFGKQLLGSDEEDEIEVQAEGRSRRVLIVRAARERASPQAVAVGDEVFRPDL